MVNGQMPLHKSPGVKSWSQSLLLHCFGDAYIFTCYPETPVCRQKWQNNAFGNTQKREGVITECIVIKIITKKIHTNWLMPIGARECNLNIQVNSIRLRLEVLDASNLGVHHSSTENCMFLWLCPSLVK